MDIYQRQTRTIIKISKYLKKTLPAGHIPEMDFLTWEFGAKESVPDKFVKTTVEKILKFDFGAAYKLVDGEIVTNE